ncbi:hypothetical protein [Amycolatopsis sacchari]|uniref:hypothetical protein n=1 Tax=Amycolatopsis sacchari TaxID=115433 RepID=UPI003D740E75
MKRRNNSRSKHLVIALVVTAVAATAWVLYVADVRWVKETQYVATFITLMALTSWVRYGSARKAEQDDPGSATGETHAVGETKGDDR